MELSTVLIAFLLALLGTAAIFFVPYIPYYFIKRRLWRQFAELQCVGCQRSFGLQAIESGEDISPFEELWEDPDGGPVSVGCQPICLSVVCPNCQRTWELRYNSQGEWFGPEFSVNEPEGSEEWEELKIEPARDDDQPI